LGYSQTTSKQSSQEQKMNRQEMERVAKDKVMKARAAIVQSRRFYGVLIANVEPVPCWSVPRMATDSVKHYYNPQFVCELSQKMLEGVQVHESEHDARHHSTRRRGRDPERWNKACDFSINPDIIAEGFELPEWVLNRPDLAGMAAEDIYRILEIEEQQQQQQEQNEDGDDDADEDEAGDVDGDAGEDVGDDGDESGADDAGEDADADDDGADAVDGDDGTGEADDGDEGETGDEGAGDGEAAGDDAGDGEAEGEGDGDDAGEDADAGADVGEDVGEDVDGDGDGDATPRPGYDQQPWDCGGVLDAPAEQAADLDAKWDVVAHQAAALAKKQGTLPGHWESELERRKTPTEDWREEMRQFFDAGASRSETWNRPNRRFAHTGFVLPGTQRDGINKVVFLVDTSGSMSDDVLNKVSNEVQAAMDAGVISEAVVVYNDTKVNHVDRYLDGDQIEFKAVGRGGTDLRPAFQWIDDNDPDCSLIVALTDLEIGDPGPEPQAPVLWAAYGSPSTVKYLKAMLPFGDVIDVGAHV
jgi:predicted metal-dependent peptidase